MDVFDFMDPLSFMDANGNRNLFTQAPESVKLQLLSPSYEANQMTDDDALCRGGPSYIERHLKAVQLNALEWASSEHVSRAEVERAIAQLKNKK